MGARAPKLKKIKLPKVTPWTVVQGFYQAVWFLGWLVVKTVEFTTVALAIATVKTVKVGVKYGGPAAAKAAKWTARTSRRTAAAAAHKTADRLADSRPRFAAWAQRLGDRIGPAPLETTPTPTGSRTANNLDRQPSRTNTRQGESKKSAAPATSQPSSPSGGQSVKTPANTHGGIRMQEFQHIVQAAQPLSQLEASNAWELDEQLAAFAALWPKLAEVFASYGEYLDRVLKVDPRVVQSFYSATGDMSELFRSFGGVRGLFRVLYADAFAQAESNVRDISKEKFWDKANAA